MSQVRRAFVTGITGQDGSYLVEQLLDGGTEVHGLVRPGHPAGAASSPDHPAAHLHVGDLDDTAGLARVLDEVEPDEVYNLAGISSVAQSWQEPTRTAQLSGLAVAALLDAAFRLQERRGSQVSFIQASSAEMFGDPDRAPQDESTTIHPLSPYGAAKAFAHHLTGVYRSRGLHAVGCILFNHESPRRPTTFVTRKITVAAARIGIEGSGTIRLGNLDSRRDWGWAPDYVDAMVRAARRPVAEDFVLATGQTHSVREFAEVALRRAGVGDDWAQHVEVDPQLIRPLDAPVLVGDASKAARLLGWRSTVGFEEVVARMVDNDLELLRK